MASDVVNLKPQEIFEIVEEETGRKVKGASGRNQKVYRKTYAGSRHWHIDMQRKRRTT